MGTLTMAELAKAMGKIDFTMLTTRTDGGQLATRPMSNNGDVDYDGSSYYFSWDSARTVKDIAADAKVALSFQGSAGMFGKPPLFVAVEGTAKIERDRALFAKHWVDGLERWFPEGIDTKGMVMIHVDANRIHYWDGNEDGELVM
jgi:general stress protein 26